MPENSKPQSVTIRGGVNVAPTETTKPRGRPPGSTKTKNHEPPPAKPPQEPAK